MDCVTMTKAHQRVQILGSLLLTPNGKVVGKFLSYSEPSHPHLEHGYSHKWHWLTLSLGLVQNTCCVATDVCVPPEPTRHRS